MRKGLIIILGVALIGYLLYQTTLKPMKQADDSVVIREGVLNEVAIGDSVERVIKFFGNSYDQEEQTIQFGEEVQTYLVYQYVDALIYTEDRLVKAIELITPTYVSPRGPKVGSTRSEIEHYYWRPAGYTGQESRYVFTFNANLVFYFDETGLVKRILLY